MNDLAVEGIRNAEESIIDSWTPHSTFSQYLLELFQRLSHRFGRQAWWPAENRFEVMVGAVLTQNTNWKNVERAISNLKKRDLLSLEALHLIPPSELAEIIRPAGYFNIKTKRLKNLMAFLMTKYQGDLSLFYGDETDVLREGLLSVKGVGPETADSILLYAVHRPVFVVDSYTYRILNRHGLADEPFTYDELQALFEHNLPESVTLYNEFHALLVQTGKHFCKKTPLCRDCPLQHWGPQSPQ
jgi:endonuclease-3 related protein